MPFPNPLALFRPSARLAGRVGTWGFVLTDSIRASVSAQSYGGAATEPLLLCSLLASEARRAFPLK